MNRLQHKLSDYSETPPASAWNAIQAALEAPAYAQKLYDFEQKPPAAAWEKISRQLAAPEAKVILLRTKLFKYAIAAAVLITIAGASIFYLQHTTGPKLATQPQNSTPENTLFDTQQPGAGEENASSGNNTPTDAAGSGLTAENDLADQAIVRFSATVRIAKNRFRARQITIVPEEKNIINTDLTNRYMIATTSSGNVVRLPKKAYSEYACAEAYNSHPCKEKLATIQSKMAASVATDFTDFIDLLQNLQDN